MTKSTFNEIEAFEEDVFTRMDAFSIHDLKFAENVRALAIEWEDFLAKHGLTEEAWYAIVLKSFDNDWTDE